MAEAVLMPKVGISVESCIITEWYKQPGDSVALGEALFGYETDKSSMDCESTAAGTLLERWYENGDEVPVLVPVCAVGQAGEDVSALRPGGGGRSPEAGSAHGGTAEPAAGEAAPGVVRAEPLRAAGDEVTAPAQPTTPANTAPVSPRAKSLAARQGLNPAYATPSGPNGRVIERDILALAQSGAGAGAPMAGHPSPAVGGGASLPGQPAANASGPEYTDTKFTGVRKAISAGMSASLANIPQLTHHFSFDATALQNLRAALKNQAEALGLPNITLNDMVLYAVARTLPLHPALNAHMTDPLTLRQFRDVHLGMAVDTPRGLVVPVIRNAHALSLAQLAAEAKRLGQRAQQGALTPDEMAGGTFTVSNLGVLGVEMFTPVINPPQTGILGVCAITPKVRQGNGGFEVYPAMGLSLTYDHRAIDGAPASRFAAEVCALLENFPVLLVS